MKANETRATHRKLNEENAQYTIVYGEEIRTAHHWNDARKILLSFPKGSGARLTNQKGTIDISR